MRTLNFSEQFDMAGFLSRLLKGMKPRSCLRSNFTVHVRELQTSLLFAKFLEYGDMLHWLFTRHTETHNVKVRGGALLRRPA